MRTFKLGIAIIASCLTGGCATISDFGRVRESLIERDREWSSIAAEGRDVERIVAFWTEDAIVTPPGAPVIRGKAAIREYVKSSLAIPGFQIRWSPASASVSSDGTLGYTTGENVVSVPGADGKLITITGRYTTVWQRDDGNWRCVVDIWNSGP